MEREPQQAEAADKIELRRNPYRLTLREVTVIHHVASGRTDKEIAIELGISPLTVHKHIANTLARMNAASRT